MKIEFHDLHVLILESDHDIHKIATIHRHVDDMFDEEVKIYACKKCDTRYTLDGLMYPNGTW